MRIRRRDLLRLRPWAASTGLFPAVRAAEAGRREPMTLIGDRPKHVPVVGAGLSGLVAAYELTIAGELNAAD